MYLGIMTGFVVLLHQLLYEVNNFVSVIFFGHGETCKDICSF